MRTYERVLHLLNEYKGRAGKAPDTVFMGHRTLRGVMRDEAPEQTGLTNATYCGCRLVEVMIDDFIAVGYEA